MISKNTLVLFIGILVLAQGQVNKNCCSNYDKSGLLCLSCPLGSFYQANNCIAEIDNCLEFGQCFRCSKCAEGFMAVDAQILGLQIKKCQSVNSYNQIKVQQKSSEKSYEAYAIADDFLKNSRSQIKTNGKLKNASFKKIGEQLYFIMLDYQITKIQDGLPKYYRALMRIDLIKYDFTEVSYLEITKQQIGNKRQPVLQQKKVEQQPIQILDLVGTDATFDTYVQKTLDLTSSANFKLVQVVDKIARGSMRIFKKIVSIKVFNYKNSSLFIQIAYLTQDDLNHTIRVDALTKKVVSINGLQIYNVPFFVPKNQIKISEGSQAVTTIPENVTTKKQLSNQSQEKRQQQQITQIQSQSIVAVQSNPQSQPQSKAQDQPKTETQPTSSVITSLPPIPPTITAKSSSSIQKPPPATVDPKTGIWSKQSIVGYTLENNIEVLQDLKFSVVKDLLNKKLTGYQDILPASCYTKVEDNVKTFLMIFNKPDLTQIEVIVKVVMPNYITELVHQHKIGVFSASNNQRVYTRKQLPEVTKAPLYIPAAVQLSKLDKGYISDNLVSVSVNDDDPNTIYFKSVYNVSGKVFEVESSTKKKLRIGQFISQKDITPPQEKKIQPPKADIMKQAEQKNLTKQANQTQIKANSTVTNSNQVQQNSTQSNSTSLIAPIKTIKQKPIECEVSRAIPKIGDLLKFAPQDGQVSSLIISQITGYSRLLETNAARDISFLKTQAYVECINQKFLKNAKIIAVFTKNIGLSAIFKIYHESASKIILETCVNYDRLKGKMYILSFNPMAFGLN